VAGYWTRIGLQSDIPFHLLRMSSYCTKIRTALRKNGKTAQTEHYAISGPRVRYLKNVNINTYTATTLALGHMGVELGLSH